jgi:hypothetical protein
MDGRKGREADKTFRAFAHDDPAALARLGRMRKKGDLAEATVPWTCRGRRHARRRQVVKVAKLGSILSDWRPNALRAARRSLAISLTCKRVRVPLTSPYVI